MQNVNAGNVMCMEVNGTRFIVMGTNKGVSPTVDTPVTWITPRHLSGGYRMELQPNNLGNQLVKLTLSVNPALS